jgi:hypothetical protein
MSSSIWMRCAGDSEIRALRLTPWRVVEAQHQLSTRKLVDSAEEQMVLEELIERSKPPAAGNARLHYLLTTPFRYPPLRHGSRFGSRFERALWYGSETRRTAFAEVAYYRLLFLGGTQADLGPVATQLTAFTVSARSRRGIDLTAAPFGRHRKAIASPTDYAAAQALGKAMRTVGVELFRYPSARDSQGGVCVGAFSPVVFGAAKPHGLETWHCFATPARVELAKRDYFDLSNFAFERVEFLIDGRLPSPAV